MDAKDAKNTTATSDPTQLTEEKETLFITLRAKAYDSQQPRSILHDTKAAEILRSIDYDSSKFGESKGDLTVIRARQYDEWVREYLRAHPDAVVIYLGCGLDSRVERIDLPQTAHWFDVDFPEVIDTRRQFFSERDNYHMIASSMTEAAWLEQIPGTRPTLVIAEGALEYLEPEEVNTLFKRLLDHFQQGQLIFDIMNTFARDAGKQELKETTGAAHAWIIDDTADIDAIDPRLRKVTELSLMKSAYVRDLPLRYRLAFWAGARVPRFRDMLRLMRYEF